MHLHIIFDSEQLNAHCPCDAEALGVSVSTEKVDPCSSIEKYFPLFPNNQRTKMSFATLLHHEYGLQAFGPAPTGRRGNRWSGSVYVSLTNYFWTPTDLTLCRGKRRRSMACSARRTNSHDHRLQHAELGCNSPLPEGRRNGCRSVTVLLLLLPTCNFGLYTAHATHD